MSILQSKTRISALRQIMLGQRIEGILFASSASFAYLLGLNQFPFQRTSQTKNQRGAPVTEALNVPDCLLYLPLEGDAVVLTVPWRARDLQGSRVPVAVCFLDTFEHCLQKKVKGKR
ncbi:MAG: hypothetical protein VB100_08795 [Angelakisella sp.]|nr:hypothetical protein [Angelakisella sp.]